MLDKDLKKMSRQELLELLLDQTKRNEKLQAKISDLEARLSDKIMTVEEKGSLAEASIAICSVLDTAQQAADIYQLNAKKMADEEANKIIENAKEEASTIRINAYSYAKNLQEDLNSAAQEYAPLADIIRKYEIKDNGDSVTDEVLDL